MAQTIMTNVASLNSQRQLNKSQSALNTSLERLSSGLRINSAKDDAAGLAISDRMTSQINGLDQAVANSNDGISLAQTAESALGTITDNLQRIRELSVQSANATNSASDRASIQAEVTQLTEEITRVAKDTQFNGINLLDGTFANQTFQVGANAGQTITVANIASAKSSALGVQQIATTGTAMSSVATTATTNAVLAETDLVLTTAKDGISTGVITWAADSDAKTIAAAINTASGVAGNGITATATNSATLNGLTADGDITMTLNGSAIVATGVETDDLTNLVTAINAASTDTGVTASFSTSGSTSSITLTGVDGVDIDISAYTSTSSGEMTVTQTSSAGTTTGTASSTLNATTAAATVTGTVTLSSSQGTISTADANADVFAVADVNTSALSSVEDIDVTTAAGATAAITVVDAALSAIDSARGDLGAIQNRFTSVVSNLESSSENMSASRSRIQDADFAAETAAMSKNQILQQAGTAMLAQANSLPQNVLTLLQ